MRRLIFLLVLVLWIPACSRQPVIPEVQATPTSPAAIPEAPATIAAPTGAQGSDTFIPLVQSPPCETHTAAMDISAPQTTLKVGEQISVTVILRNEGCVALGLPQYRLAINPKEEPSTLEPSQPEPVVHYLAVQPGHSDTAVFGLQAAGVGQAELRATASFEVHLGYPGPAYWGSSGTGEPLSITIEP